MKVILYLAIVFIFTFLFVRFYVHLSSRGRRKNSVSHKKPGSHESDYILPFFGTQINGNDDSNGDHGHHHHHHHHSTHDHSGGWFDSGGHSHSGGSYSGGGGDSGGSYSGGGGDSGSNSSGGF